jgi:hypothetical protein
VTTKGRQAVITAGWLALIVLSALVQPQAQADKNAQADKKAEADKKKPEKSYGLIFGTAYGPDDRPLYGVKITIHPQGKKHPHWELLSDHRGEFAQRVPPGPADYLVQGEAEYAPMGGNGKPQMSKKKKLKGETRVHVDGQERQDVGIHLSE